MVMAVFLKFLNNFCRAFEMPSINFEINLILTWSPSCVIKTSTGMQKFTITDNILYLADVTRSTENNRKSLH